MDLLFLERHRLKLEIIVLSKIELIYQEMSISEMMFLLVQIVFFKVPISEIEHL